MPEVSVMRVVETRAINPIIRLVRLAPEDGCHVAEWSAGAHIQIEVTLPDGSRDWRDYSLIDMAGLPGVGHDGNEFVVAVRKDENGRGGSIYVHENLAVGDPIQVRAPQNDFALNEHSGPVVFLAGGIGVTPLLSMVCRCMAEGRDIRFHYAGRSRSLMAFVGELEALLGSRIHVHADDEHAGSLIDLGAVLDGCPADAPLYVCGPRPMLDAILAATRDRGWEPGRLHFELFTPSAPSAETGDHAFELVLAQSGKSFEVPADQSVLDCLIEHGFDDLLYDCQRGECGVCTLDVLEGDIDHRDYVLSDEQKASGKVMQICVSRAKGNRLVLDL